MQYDIPLFAMTTYEISECEATNWLCNGAWGHWAGGALCATDWWSGIRRSSSCAGWGGTEEVTTLCRMLRLTICACHNRTNVYLLYKGYIQCCRDYVHVWHWTRLHQSASKWCVGLDDIWHNLTCCRGFGLVMDLLWSRAVSEGFVACPCGTPWGSFVLKEFFAARHKLGQVKDLKVGGWCWNHC